MQELAGNSGALQAQDLDLPVFCISCELVVWLDLFRVIVLAKLPARSCSVSPGLSPVLHAVSKLDGFRCALCEPERSRLLAYQQKIAERAAVFNTSVSRKYDGQLT